jgi:hypothetical protein
MLRVTVATLVLLALGLGASPATARADGEAYRSPMRAECTEELRRDAEWLGALRAQLTDRLLVPSEGDDTAIHEWRARTKKALAVEVHTEDANLMLTNKRHVVAAYAVLWVVVVLFLVLMWNRQRRLKDEIARLERDLREAAKT